MIAFRRTILTAMLACGAGLPNSAVAQAQPAPAAPAPAAPAPVAPAPAAPAPVAPAPAAAVAPTEDLLKAEALDQLLAPIALYPDNLLAQTLMASTYPLEVVNASRWVKANKKLKGEQLRKAVDAQTWDDSVKSLVATPSVLEMMDARLPWTQKLGDAVLAQQTDVMDAVQRLRARAQAAKKLETTKEQKVSVKTEQSKQVIVIEPAQPETIYVPYYDPSVVYGAWPYSDYPPYYFPMPDYYYGGALLATGLAFGAGIALGAWVAGGRYWGAGVGWGNTVNPLVNRNGNWRHDPSHRQGVRYSNANVANQFGKGNQVRGGERQTAGDRGRDGAGDRGRDGAGDRQKGGDRAAGQKGGDRATGQKGADRGGGQKAAGQKAAGQKAAGQKAGDRAAGQKGGDRAGGQRAADRAGGQRPGGGDSAMTLTGGGRAAAAQSARGNASLGGGGFAGGGGFQGGGGGGFRGGGGGGFGGGGGGGFRGGGGGGFGGGGGGGGRRSDIRLKHDITLLGRLDNGIGFYRFSYNGSDKAYVGVMAQEVQVVMPDAVTRDREGMLRVRYDMLGVPFQSYDRWIGSGARVPVAGRAR